MIIERFIRSPQNLVSSVCFILKFPFFSTWIISIIGIFNTEILVSIREFCKIDFQKSLIGISFFIKDLVDAWIYNILVKKALMEFNPKKFEIGI